ncbi:acyl-CoA N-acyltransferase [Mariannaea sp. PMI_226]|nr:acyl-CoA N-acyltransferase [Mariannaea sp. PMI_226]
MAVPMITDGLPSTFCSERLMYSAPENNEETKRFIHEELKNNPAIIALAEPGLVRPVTMSRTEWVMEQVNKSDLGVMIYLRQDSPAGSSSSSTDTKAKTPIGFLVLGWGGTPPNWSHHRSTSLGITLAPAYQNNGYGSEAINWGLDWAFRYGGFHRVAIGTVSFNKRAASLYPRLGFVEEGRSRESIWYDRKWYDMIAWSMLESEWEVLRGRKSA